MKENSKGPLNALKTGKATWNPDPYKGVLIEIGQSHECSEQNLYCGTAYFTGLELNKNRELCHAWNFRILFQTLDTGLLGVYSV